MIDEMKFRFLSSAVAEFPNYIVIGSRAEAGWKKGDLPLNEQVADEYVLRLFEEQKLPITPYLLVKCINRLERALTRIPIHLVAGPIVQDITYGFIPAFQRKLKQVTEVKTN